MKKFTTASVLVLDRIEIENANAIAGLTYGFPAVTAIKGFVHALDRKLRDVVRGSLGGCAIVCHTTSLQTKRFGNEEVFCLTRNPLRKNGTSPSFAEEGRMHMKVSLIIECDFTARKLDFGGKDREADINEFCSHVSQVVNILRLAGGTVRSIEDVRFLSVEQDREAASKWLRKLMLSFLPGFLLIDRTSVLRQHAARIAEIDPSKDMLDALLDFVAMKEEAREELISDESGAAITKAKWERIPKPAPGWIVPLATGYRALRPPYPPGEVVNARDASVPFCFVETVYGLGEWISPHRVENLESVVWTTSHVDGWYTCSTKSDGLSA